LERLAADREAQELVPKTDAEQRLLADEAADRVDGVRERLRVAGAVGEEDAVGVVIEDLFRRRGAGDDGDLAADLAEAPKDVPLHPEVDGHDSVPLPELLERLRRER